MRTGRYEDDRMVVRGKKSDEIIARREKVRMLINLRTNGRDKFEKIPKTPKRALILEANVSLVYGDLKQTALSLSHTQQC